MLCLSRTVEDGLDFATGRAGLFNNVWRFHSLGAKSENLGFERGLGFCLGVFWRSRLTSN
jgi:hypothetical protein